ITMEACLRTLEAFISPSAATTSLDSRVASASAAITLCMAIGILISLISTRATLIPHCSVGSHNHSFSFSEEQILKIHGNYEFLLVSLAFPPKR
uniref:Uncharacterized protein n=1 Tax=Meleagris gallopavo TaxID=9103 RepID=A0A803XRR7_MELGA